MFYQSKGKWEENTIKDLFLSFNSYNLRARISVMILLFAPGLTNLYLLVPEMKELSTTVITIIIVYSLCNTFIIFSRTLGPKAMRKCYPDLLPAQQYLLPSDTTLEKMTKDRYYRFFENKIEDFQVSSDDDEMKPMVETAVTWLIAKTRDVTQFSLINEENINFGTSYNLLGVKAYALGFAILNLGINIVSIVLKRKEILSLLYEVLISAAIITLLFIMIWCFIINKKLVKRCGRNYAKALLSACDSTILNQ